MEAINITNARQNLYSLAEKAVNMSMPVKILSKKGDVVLISEADYEALMETVYLLSVPGLREDLIAGRKESIEESTALEDADWLTE